MNTFLCRFKLNLRDIISAQFIDTVSDENLSRKSEK